MADYFVISDTHSYATAMKTALRQAGFCKSNKNHVLIICGDLFDRGDGTLEIYKYIKSIPKSRRILIRGNHELLYLDLLTKSYPENFDFSNGTVKTFCDIAGEEYDKLWSDYWKPKIKNPDTIAQKILATWTDIKIKVAESEITKWLKSTEWQNYYELNNYIFVHSFIPLKLKQISETKWFKNYPKSELPYDFLEYNPKWRTDSTELDWEDASWGCPWKLFKAGFFKPEINKNKILVCGHWHTSDFHQAFEGVSDNFSLFYDKYLIGLDACTAYTGEVNVLVIKPDGCYDKYKHKLKIKGEYCE